MGSNVSRHSGKGLSGRRAQSSGSLYRMLAPRVGKMLNPCGNGNVRQRDRNKFCGSLPNHLDEKQVSSEKSSPGSLYHPELHLEEIYQRTKAKNVEFMFRGVPQDLAAGDQGYGSEWSPEDELLHSISLEPNFFFGKSSEVAFINKENIFEARLEKGSRGLGLSVTGGIDTTDIHPGLIRIKRIFPHQPAWESGALELNDIILEANGTPLTGLTNHEALEVLRTTTSNVILKICRPPRNTFYAPSPMAKEPPPPPPVRDPNQHVVCSSQNNNSPSKLPIPSSEPYGEFSVVLHKVNGSLGFTLKKEDESILGHYVRALVREPAISDGRIRPGDKIVLVNETDISTMSHEEAVLFLRQCGDEVKLRLYRDPAQTPVLALSPTESHKKIRPKPVLRKEAMDMLSDLAVKKFNPDDSSSSSSKNRLKSSSPSSSPRRRKLTKIPINTEEKPETPNFSVLGEKMEKDSKNVAEEVVTEKSLLSLKENSESASMPPIPTFNSDFSYKNPVYQSAHIAAQTESKPGAEKALDRQQIDSEIFQEKEGSQGLLKWKGIVFTDKEEGQEDKEKNKAEYEIEQVVTVELCKGWNSRLGFSLKSCDSKTLISAIYPDSVAAKDGRLQLGDEVVKINDESTKGMSTSDVIDLLRKIRGMIEITVVRNSISNKS